MWLEVRLVMLAESPIVQQVDVLLEVLASLQQVEVLLEVLASLQEVEACSSPSSS